MAALVSPKQRMKEQHDPENNEIKDLKIKIINLTLKTCMSGPSLLKLLNLEIDDDVNKKQSFKREQFKIKVLISRK